MYLIISYQETFTYVFNHLLPRDGEAIAIFAGYLSNLLCATAL